MRVDTNKKYQTTTEKAKKRRGQEGERRMDEPSADKMATHLDPLFIPLPVKEM